MHVYPDSRARFADPTNPDRPPMPPDDPAAYDLSPNPQKPGKPGVARVEGSGYLDLMTKWDAENRAEASTTGKDSDGGKPASGPMDKPGGPLKEESQTRVDEDLPAWVRFLLVPKSDAEESPTSLIRQVSASVEDQPAGSTGQQAYSGAGKASFTTSLSAKPGDVPRIS